MLDLYEHMLTDTMFNPWQRYLAISPLMGVKEHVSYFILDHIMHFSPESDSTTHFRGFTHVFLPIVSGTAMHVLILILLHEFKVVILSIIGYNLC